MYALPLFLFTFNDCEPCQQPLSSFNLHTMPLLHIVNKSHFDHNALRACLRLIKRGSGILLIEDAVYAAQKSPAIDATLAGTMVENSVYALVPDLHARGIPCDKVLHEVTVVDYAGFVDLAVEYDNTVSWL